MDLDNTKNLLLESRKEAAELLVRAEKAERELAEVKLLLERNEGRVKEIVDEKLLRERDEYLALVCEMRTAIDYINRREISCERYKDDDAVPKRNCINTGHPQHCEGCVTLLVANITPKDALERQRARRRVVEEAVKALGPDMSTESGFFQPLIRMQEAGHPLAVAVDDLVNLIGGRS